jgi:hypothetical protein
VQLARQRRGLPLAKADGDAVMFTNRVVALVGVTLAAGVVTWAFSPIKFQADMGILLTFMFLWNMSGAGPDSGAVELPARRPALPGRCAGLLRPRPSSCGTASAKHPPSA